MSTQSVAGLQDEDGLEVMEELLDVMEVMEELLEVVLEEDLLQGGLVQVGLGLQVS